MRLICDKCRTDVEAWVIGRPRFQKYCLIYARCHDAIDKIRIKKKELEEKLKTDNRYLVFRDGRQEINEPEEKASDKSGSAATKKC